MASPTPTDPQTTTLDRLLGGHLELEQPAAGSHRAGLDPIMLAAAVAAAPGERIADLGAGVGTAGLAACRRLDSVYATLVEIDEGLAALARRNAERNGLGERVVVLAADIAAPAAARQAAGLEPESFDQVIVNPPFHPPGRVRVPPGQAKARAYVQAADLDRWVRTATALLKPQGILTLIHRADALGELLAAFSGRFGAIAVKPLHPRRHAAATRIIIRATKASRAPLVLLPGLVLHPEGENGYTAEADAILRGAALDMTAG